MNEVQAANIVLSDEAFKDTVMKPAIDAAINACITAGLDKGVIVSISATHNGKLFSHVRVDAMNPRDCLQPAKLLQDEYDQAVARILNQLE